MADLDGERVGRARMKEVVEIIREQMTDAVDQLVRSLRIRARAGPRRSSASRTSSGSGRQLRSAPGSTRPTRCRRGATTWHGSRRARRELNELELDAVHYRGRAPI